MENDIKNDKLVEMFKAISNITRLEILQLLKEPEKNFPTQTHSKKEGLFVGGVCVSDIQNKIGLGQSTTSHYLSFLQQSGLLEMQRIGKWTYYRRNEKSIKQLERFLGGNL